MTSSTESTRLYLLLSSCCSCRCLGHELYIKKVDMTFCYCLDSFCQILSPSALSYHLLPCTFCVIARYYVGLCVCATVLKVTLCLGCHRFHRITSCSSLFCILLWSYLPKHKKTDGSHFSLIIAYVERGTKP